MKKNTKIFATAAITLTFAGSLLAYNLSFAAEGEETLSTVEVSTVEPVAVESEVQPVGKEILAEPLAEQPSEIPPRIDISEFKDEIKIPLDLADPTVKAAASEKTENPIAKKVEVQARGQQLIVIYQLEDGKSEVIISQSQNTLGNVDEAVEVAKSWYNATDVKTLEINGHTAVIQDAVNQKQVHLITDTHFFTVASPGTLNLDYLIELAGDISIN
ncbi:hypothetical protein IJ21_33490 [Paenibacillus sp. 32O-W]|uniref:hypothetical protein n=1 Tax=Paenibacillus sp. 32O-W TaxID=1695218 RepID=UPI00072071EB|nr:hypothetical protein [Paenibacillus sp. 32O-W]ALS28738.1 hypothetical protein IJ21_33490 [Paenibacillus sp. 32O-W]